MTDRNSSLVTTAVISFATFSHSSFTSLVTVNPVVFAPVTQSRAGAWSRTFSAGFLPSLDDQMTVYQVLQNTPVTISVFMRDASTGLPITGLSPSAFTIKLKKSTQGSFSTITPTVTEVGLGWYDIAITAAQTDTVGKAPLEVAATGAATRDDTVMDVIPGPGGQIKSNSFTDKRVYSGTNMTSCRVRVFVSASVANTAADADADGAHGEVERYRITCTYNLDGTLKTYSYVKEL